MDPHLSSGRGTVRRRLDDHEATATATAPDGMADLRARIGDEAVDQFQRSMVLHRQPWPLAGDQAAVLREAVAPVLRDLRATGKPCRISGRSHIMTAARTRYAPGSKGLASTVRA